MPCRLSTVGCVYVGGPESGGVRVFPVDARHLQVGKWRCRLVGGMFAVPTRPVASRTPTAKPRLIRELLHSGEPIFCFDFFPPRTPEANERLWPSIRELDGLDPAFVS